MTDRITGPSRAATAEIIGRLAAAGRDDPAIAARLGITAAQVRGLRKQFDIPPGEIRWKRTPALTEVREQLESPDA